MVEPRGRVHPRDPRRKLDPLSQLERVDGERLLSKLPLPARPPRRDLLRDRLDDHERPARSPSRHDLVEKLLPAGVVDLVERGPEEDGVIPAKPPAACVFTPAPERALLPVAEPDPDDGLSARSSLPESDPPRLRLQPEGAVGGSRFVEGEWGSIHPDHLEPRRAGKSRRSLRRARDRRGKPALPRGGPCGRAPRPAP